MSKKLSVIAKLFIITLTAILAVASLAACKTDNESSDESSSSIFHPAESIPESTPLDTTPPETTNPETTPPEAAAPETNPESETTSPPAPSPITLNIGSYNIKNGMEVKLKIEKLGQDIKSKNLDIVGVQEVDRNTDRNMRMDTIKKLSESSGLSYYSYFKALDIKGGEYGVGILSRYPIIETKRTELYSENVEQRVLGHAVIDVDGVMVNFFVTHLSYESMEIRSKQFAAIAKQTTGLDNFIITGDFNTNDFREYAIIRNSAMVNNADHSILTFPNPNPTSSIDNIIYSKNSWSFEKPEVLINGHSDHCMLYATGTLNPN